MVGLSGIGKARIVQASFEVSLRTHPLDESLAIYADLGTEVRLGFTWSAADDEIRPGREVPANRIRMQAGRGGGAARLCCSIERAERIKTAVPYLQKIPDAQVRTRARARPLPRFRT